MTGGAAPLTRVLTLCSRVAPLSRCCRVFPAVRTVPPQARLRSCPGSGASCSLPSVLSFPRCPSLSTHPPCVRTIRALLTPRAFRRGSAALVYARACAPFRACVGAACTLGAVRSADQVASGNRCRSWQRCVQRPETPKRQAGHPRNRGCPASNGLWSRDWSLHRLDERSPRTGGHAEHAAVAVLGVAHHDRVGGTGDFYALATVRTRVAGGTPVACCLHSRAPSSIRQRLSVPRNASVLSASNPADSSRTTLASSKTWPVSAVSIYAAAPSTASAMAKPPVHSACATLGTT